MEEKKQRKRTVCEKFKKVVCLMPYDYNLEYIICGDVNIPSCGSLVSRQSLITSPNSLLPNQPCKWNTICRLNTIFPLTHK